MMSNELQKELSKAFSNRWFFIALIIGCTITTVSAVCNITVDYQASQIGIEYLDSKFLDFSSSSCFKYWVVVDFIQPATELFFLILPLLAVLPYSWSYLEESRNGYIGLIVTRTKRTNYFFAKYMAVFLSGASVVAIPIMLNFLICACFMPAYTPDVFAVIYFGIFEEQLWSEVFYTNPALYVVMFTLLCFVFSGLWAVVVSVLSSVIKNRVALTIVPYLFLIFTDFISDTVFGDLVNVELTPFGFLRGVGVTNATDGTVVAVILIVLFLISSLGMYSISKRDVS